MIGVFRLLYSTTLVISITGRSAQVLDVFVYSPHSVERRLNYNFQGKLTRNTFWDNNRKDGIDFRGESEDKICRKGHDQLGESRSTCLPVTRCFPLFGSTDVPLPRICGWFGLIPAVCCPYLPKTESVIVFEAHHVDGLVDNNHRSTSTAAPITVPLSLPSGASIVPASTSSGISAPTSTRATTSATAQPISLQPTKARLDKDSGASHVSHPSCGRAIENNKYSWIAAIHALKGSRLSLLCTGAILNERYVITTAFCVKRYIENSDDLRVSVNDGSGNSYFVDEIIFDPNYNGSTRGSVALLRVAPRLVFSRTINAVCLPDNGLKNDRIPSQSLFVGFSNNRIPDKVTQVTDKRIIVPKNVCDQVLNKTVKELSLKVDDTFLCAINSPLFGLSCESIPGGLLMRRWGNRWTLLGLESLQPKCGDFRVPGLYVDVTISLRWVSDIVSQ